MDVHPKCTIWANCHVPVSYDMREKVWPVKWPLHEILLHDSILFPRLLANGYPTQMYHLGQLLHPRLLEHERKSPASKMTHPWDFAPWLHLVFKLLSNGCPSQIHTQGQFLSSYDLKPMRKDLASIMSFILRLLIFGGQNLNECVQMLMPNLCMTS